MGALELHPDVEAIDFLLGTWRGSGRGGYPTVEPFEYGEEITFTHVGKPFLAYRQRTWAPDDGRPLHSEAGFLRVQPGGSAELVLAEPTGHVEVHAGTVGGGRLELASTLVARTATAKAVDAVRRVIDVDGDGLHYRVEMAAVGKPLQVHLEGTLHRQTT